MVTHISLSELQGAAQLGSSSIWPVFEYIQQALASGFHRSAAWVGGILDPCISFTINFLNYTR
jgi:hypothetical protein